MTTASERIMVQGLSLADAHKISDQLRTRSHLLQEEDRKLCDLLAVLTPGCAGHVASEAVLAAVRHDREAVLACREAMSAALALTFNNLG